MNKVPSFSGFPEECFHFLRELAVNNNREWFNARKADYLNNVLLHTQTFVVALGDRLKMLSRGIVYDTRTDGSGSIMRIYRDTRFSRDKSPYNTNVRVVFWEGERKKTENPGFFFGMDGRGATIFAGQHTFPEPTLEAYRNAVVDGKLGVELEKAISSVTKAGNYVIAGGQSKRVPRGYDSEHERADLLRYKGLYASSPQIDRAVLSTPEGVEVCFEHCRKMVPLQQWLVKVAQRARS